MRQVPPVSMHIAPIEQKTKTPKGATTSVFDARFQADNLSTREALVNIRSALERDNFSTDLIARVEIVLAELFNNIAEHAYRNSGFGEVRCSMGLGERSIIVEVTDQGGPMPGGEIPEGSLPDMSVALNDLPEGGFGWFLIKSQSDDLSHQRMALGNCTRLSFNILGNDQR